MLLCVCYYLLYVKDLVRTSAECLDEKIANFYVSYYTSLLKCYWRTQKVRIGLWQCRLILGIFYSFSSHAMQKVDQGVKSFAFFEGQLS
jgi:hypothetical protein